MDDFPKRRKHKDNPYTIKTIDNRYYILFKDGEDIPRTVEVPKNIFDIFNQFELVDLKELNEFDRHFEHKELSEESIFNRGTNGTESLDDFVIRKISYEERMKMEFYYLDKSLVLQQNLANHYKKRAKALF